MTTVNTQKTIKFLKDYWKELAFVGSGLAALASLPFQEPKYVDPIVRAGEKSECPPSHPVLERNRIIFPLGGAGSAYICARVP